MNKKLILSAAAVAAIGAASFAAFNSNTPTREFSDLELANIEALTDDEAGGFTCKWKRVLEQTGGVPRLDCVSDGNGFECTCGDVQYL